MVAARKCDGGRRRYKFRRSPVRSGELRYVDCAAGVITYYESEFDHNSDDFCEEYFELGDIAVTVGYVLVRDDGVRYVAVLSAQHNCVVLVSENEWSDSFVG